MIFSEDLTSGTFFSCYANAINVLHFICDIAFPIESAAVLVSSYNLSKHRYVANNLILNCIYCATLPHVTFAMFLVFASQN